MEIIRNSLHQSHEIICSVVKQGDVVVDATAGNGNDTAFLAELVGESGKVYSFDVQEAALNNTKRRLEVLGMAGRVQLVLDGHENLDRHVPENIKAAMFNLGYLPGGDHSIGTMASTTILALEKLLERIQLNGIITIVIYYGGDSGFMEKDQVLEYIKTIDSKRYTVMRTEFVNQANCPPILICIERIAP